MTILSDKPNVWHETLPIQVPLTFKQQGTEIEIIAPGNDHPWCIGTLSLGSNEQAEAYARLFVASPALFDAMEDMRALCVHADQYTSEHFARKISDKIDATLAAAKGESTHIDTKTALDNGDSR